MRAMPGRNVYSRSFFIRSVRHALHTAIAERQHDVPLGLRPTRARLVERIGLFAPHGTAAHRGSLHRRSWDSEDLARVRHPGGPHLPRRRYGPPALSATSNGSRATFRRDWCRAARRAGQQGGAIGMRSCRSSRGHGSALLAQGVGTPEDRLDLFVRASTLARHLVAAE